MSKPKINLNENYREYKGEIEFIFKDKYGNVINNYIEPNIVKIFAKEILSHRMYHSKVWDRSANGGSGGWVSNPIDPNEDFAVKYMLFGASYDENGTPTDNDERYYTVDPVTNVPLPNRLSPGADYDGSLINPIPLSEPERPLKRIERVDFEPTYQPAGTPQLQNDVRALNNIVLLETTLLAEEYNGFNLGTSGTSTGTAGGDFFNITEVALVAGKELDSVGDCNCTPQELFLEGNDGLAFAATANGTDVITLDVSANDIDVIKEGDQIKIVAANGTSATDDTLDQVCPYYLVLSKTAGGRDLQLDRVPTDSNQNPLVGSVGVFKNTLRIFSHRILSTPVKKSSDLEILVRWRIFFN